MLVLLYHDHWNMLCTMNSGQSEQDIILMSYTSTNYNVYNKSNEVPNYIFRSMQSSQQIWMDSAINF